MSAYDTVDRRPSFWVRVYCEVPMDEESAVYLSLPNPVAYMSPDEAIRLATALLTAAQKAKHAMVVDGVVGGT
jgi:hypothetical protein